MFFPQMISEEMIKENPEHKSFIIKGRVVAEHQTIDLETKNLQQSAETSYYSSALDV